MNARFFHHLLQIHSSETEFREMSENVHRICKAIACMGFIWYTLIQSQSLLLAVQLGCYLLVRAHTGSGKMLHKVLQDKDKEMNKGDGSDSDDNNSDDNFVKSVILVPTQKLCHRV